MACLGAGKRRRQGVYWRECASPFVTGFGAVGQQGRVERLADVDRRAQSAGHLLEDRPGGAAVGRSVFQFPAGQRTIVADGAGHRRQLGDLGVDRRRGERRHRRLRVRGVDHGETAGDGAGVAGGVLGEEPCGLT